MAGLADDQPCVWKKPIMIVPNFNQRVNYTIEYDDDLFVKYFHLLWLSKGYFEEFQRTN